MVKWEMGKAEERLPKANMLILDNQADEYKRALEPKFPEVRIHKEVLLTSTRGIHGPQQDAEKDPARRLLKNAQIQGARNPEE
jgi:hypothetical protein